MPKPLVLHALARFVAATAGRNMTKAAYAAVAVGVLTMVLLTVDPAYETAHHWVDGVLWACWYGSGKRCRRDADRPI
jgi:voltage-gated potassium channel